MTEKTQGEVRLVAMTEEDFRFQRELPADAWEHGITEEEARELAHAATNDGYFVSDYPVVSKLRSAFQ